jgi:carbonic anhydrase/acetyltransferase-like protein (isoleucine patch superfamily)
MPIRDLSLVRTAPTPIPPGVFVAPGAQIVGDVRIGAGCSFWYNTVARGDLAYIQLGERVNVQDGSVIHVDTDRPTIIGDDVTIGHGCIIHGCVIEDRCLIGMGAILLNGAHIKSGTVIGAGAVVRENSVVEPFSLAAGVPAKVLKTLPPETAAARLRHASDYVNLAGKFMTDRS